MRVDINCDIGESYGHYTIGHDLSLMDYISSCNIACGYHAGDPVVMQETVHQAAKKELGNGAHHSYPDLLRKMQSFQIRNKSQSAHFVSQKPGRS